MSDTPRKTLYFDHEYTERDGLYKVDGNDYVDGEDVRRLEAELAAATARAESVERDALQRAAEVVRQEILSPQVSRYVSNKILALIPKEKA